MGLGAWGIGAEGGCDRERGYVKGDGLAGLVTVVITVAEQTVSPCARSEMSGAKTTAAGRENGVQQGDDPGLKRA